MAFPTQREIVIPLLKVLVEKGGEAPPREVYPEVARYFPSLSVDDLDARLESSPSTYKWWNMVQWVRQRLVESGDIDGAVRGLWRVTDKGRSLIGSSLVTPIAEDISSVGTVSPQISITESIRREGSATSLLELVDESHEAAKRRILQELKDLDPTDFEYFCKNFLEQLGFDQLEVTKRSNDGGIDGFGNFRQGAVRIKSAFQAKRWRDTAVGRPDIDRFRGAIQGEFDHGVFFTTSSFSRDAEDAAFRKGAISLLLLDGKSIAELMIEKGIGVKKRPVYIIDIDRDFFDFKKDR